ncbi:hypothetical protein LCGC14_0608520 [marine sediment metagenome]|uniref:Uncharacterized protein n=1 Tax=marine sediment metagenome TaxID=412755 RepID=A0A0F9RD76_9ZZZZ
MNRKIVIIDIDDTCLVARDKKAVKCAFDLIEKCCAQCAAFEKPVGTKNACMCNRGNFEIGYLKED